MKKIFSLALGLAVAFSFLGVQLDLPSFQSVPLTMAQSNAARAAVAGKGKAPIFSGAGLATATPAAGSTASASPAPSLAPTRTGQPPVQPLAAVVVAAQAVVHPPTLTVEQATRAAFAASVSGSGSDEVTGVYVPGRFALPVVQQPAGDSSFVSNQDHTATQFAIASSYGTVGLLAHNYLSGQQFFDLQEGDAVVLIQGNGRQANYRVTRIESYQALSPTSVYSDFIDVSDPLRLELSAGQVFQQIYGFENRVVFQTCIEANGDLSWGRLFVIAEKVSPAAP